MHNRAQYELNRQKRFCQVCKDNNSNHFGRNCPKGTILYHGTKKQYSDSIIQNGFKISTTGSIGPGVYFTRSFQEAKSIALYKFSQKNPVVIECFAHVDYDKFSKEDTQQEMIRKIQQWYRFCKQTAKVGMHPPWANNKQFRQVCVKDPNSILIRLVHEI